MLEWVFLFPYFLSWNRQLRRFVAKNIDDFEFSLFFTVGNFGRNREFFLFCVNAARLDISFRLKFIDFFPCPKLGMHNEHAFKRYIILLPSFSWESLLRSLPSSSSSLPLLDSASNSFLPLLICACTVYAKEKGNSQRHILFLPFSGLISHTAHSQKKKRKNTPPPPPCFPIIDSSSCAFIYSFHIFLFFRPLQVFVTAAAAVRPSLCHIHYSRRKKEEK